MLQKIFHLFLNELHYCIENYRLLLLYNNVPDTIHVKEHDSFCNKQKHLLKNLVHDLQSD